MFNKKRELEKIRLAREALETEKQLLLKEKEELLFIKNKLNDISPKIDISNVYVFREFGISYIVNLYIEHFDYQTRFNKKIKGYKTTLINIFDNIIFNQKKSTYELFREENIFDDDNKSHPITCYPIYEVEPSLLAYTDKKVPMYVLEQIYYRLNNINVNSPNLIKKQY